MNQMAAVFNDSWPFMVGNFSDYLLNLDLNVGYYTKSLSHTSGKAMFLIVLLLLAKNLTIIAKTWRIKLFNS